MTRLALYIKAQLVLVKLLEAALNVLPSLALPSAFGAGLVD